MEEQKTPTPPPREGIVYGEIAHWFLFVGMAISVVGLVVYIAAPGYVQKIPLLQGLWQGCDCQMLWSQAAGVTGTINGRWYLDVLPQPDAIAMVGIAISCLAAVIGMWGAVFQMVRSKGRLYLAFALVIAVVLTLSATGVVKMA